jgi:Transposase
MRSRIEPMKKIARTLRSHRALILDYFRARKQLSGGVVEGLNNRAKLTMRKSYGFRTFHVTETALYHALGKLPERDCRPEILLTRQMIQSDVYGTPQLSARCSCARIHIHSPSSREKGGSSRKANSEPSSTILTADQSSCRFGTMEVEPCIPGSSTWHLRASAARRVCESILAWGPPSGIGTEPTHSRQSRYLRREKGVSIAGGQSATLKRLVSIRPAGRFASERQTCRFQQRHLASTARIRFCSSCDQTKRV